MDDFGPDLVKDCGTHKVEFIEKTPEQIAKRLAQIEAALLEEEKEREKEQKKRDAIERLKKSTDKNITDLLDALEIT